MQQVEVMISLFLCLVQQTAHDAVCASARREVNRNSSANLSYKCISRLSMRACRPFGVCAAQTRAHYHLVTRATCLLCDAFCFFIRACHT